ncbi:hypothetical protein [Stenotrophomonas sp.]|uniref:hypothetical protein n=1 Tax=Stenotrophomonas sp. TaxID=69392 RepID=UPI0028A04A0C|nr:hypothetical protein [Stenotrophomonas sp.]
MKLIVSTALALVLAASATSMAVAKAPSNATVVVNHTWAADESEGQQVLAWVSTHAPRFPPLRGASVVAVERIQHFPVSQRNTPMPPNGLPDSGYPGEVYSVENTLPDGTMQSWTFQWSEPSTGHGGGWELTGYSYKKGNDPVNIQ